MTVSQKFEQKQKPWVSTPLRESYALSQAAGCRIFIKYETLQPSGSFKSRGIGHYIQCRLAELDFPKNKNVHIFSSSGGNAGLAAVYASRTLGLPCTVVVPLSTKPLMVSKLRAAGAYEVVQHGPTWADADAFLRKEVMVKSQGAAIYAPPFDHPDIWRGNSTIVPEILTQLPTASPPDAVICSVGGGGLFNGIMQSLDEHNISSTTVLAVETEGAASLNASVRAGELTSLKSITSQATSLGALQVTQESFAYAQRPNVRSVVLPDAEAAMGCWRLADDERVMVELACGVNAALCYDGRLEKAMGRKVHKDDVVVIVLCGGSNVTVEMLCNWRKEYGWVEGQVEGKGVAPSEETRPYGNGVNGHANGNGVAKGINGHANGNGITNGHA